MRILNITNGDGAANLIKQSSLGGDVLPWRDPMHHGPFPSDLPLGELSRLRARYLAGPNSNSANVERDFLLRDQHLKAANEYDSVVLWFEHDLLDQLQILQILDWFSEANLQETTLELICIDRFPCMPNFRGIGQLNAAQVSSLVGLRKPVASDMLKLAASGWAAFRSSDPRALTAFLRDDLSDLPFLAAALRRHLEEFPDSKSGLSRTETQLLDLIRQGVHSPQKLFVRNMEMETCLFMGDWPTYTILNNLCVSGLAECDPSPFQFPSFAVEQHAEFEHQRLGITEFGKRVLDGDQDAFALSRHDAWLGGIKLAASSAIWTWDPDAAALIRRET